MQLQDKYFRSLKVRQALADQNSAPQDFAGSLVAAMDEFDELERKVTLPYGRSDQV